jgi:hypothetical protein
MALSSPKTLKKKKIVYLLRDYDPIENIEHIKSLMLSTLVSNFNEIREKSANNMRKKFDDLFEVEFETFRHFIF